MMLLGLKLLKVEPKAFYKIQLLLRYEMVRTRSITRVIRRGVKKKDSGPSNLREEVKKKQEKPCYFAYMGILGERGTGRRTLAHRFGHMDGPVIQERDVPTSYWYEATLPGPYFSHPRAYPPRQYQIKLGIFIIPPPEELERRDPPLYWLLWDDFCCLLFAFDITNPSSFHWTTSKLSQFHQGEPGFYVPDCILVGNKSDRRGETPEQDRYLNIPYYEVCARNGMHVNSLLIYIRRLAISRIEL